MSLGIVLWRHREAITQRQTREGDERLANLSFLFAQFKPDKYWVCVLDLLR